VMIMRSTILRNRFDCASATKPHTVRKEQVAEVQEARFARRLCLLFEDALVDCDSFSWCNLEGCPIDDLNELQLVFVHPTYPLRPSGDTSVPGIAWTMVSRTSLYTALVRAEGS